jgi:heme exporter protein C
MGGSTIDASMLWPHFVMANAKTLRYVALLLMAMRNEIFRRRVRTLELAAAGAAPG